ncbi:hypothetical protein DFH08DRAFT_942487 [Mycena albidolilacea]|uniref:Uncharacterized protein n=1 Tax=Mycena albidolilacea TaxID=1033008 RepID=A0AAD7EEW2_9AGAR|nr:hypothetical protein DFH08DRAFT_942487 [Mycena albidolilacea]
MCVLTRYPPLSSLRSVPRLIVRVLPLPTSGCLTPPRAPARSYSNISRSLLFPSDYVSALLELSFARALPRLHPPPRTPADSLSTLGLLSAGEDMQRREEEGGEYLRQVTGAGALAREGAAHARTGGDTHARGVECTGPAASSLSLDLVAGPGAGASAFPDAEANGACVWTGDAHARGVVRAGSAASNCLGSEYVRGALLGGGRRRLSARADEPGCARRRGGQREEKEHRVRSSRARATLMPMRTRGAESSGTGPAASSDLSSQVPVLLQEVTVHSRIATSVLVDGCGRGEGTGTGARADSVSSAGGTRSSGGLAKGRPEVVGSARKRFAMPTRSVSHTCEVIRHARARARAWTAPRS